MNECVYKKYYRLFKFNGENMVYKIFGKRILFIIKNFV